MSSALYRTEDVEKQTVMGANALKLTYVAALVSHVAKILEAASVSCDLYAGSIYEAYTRM